MGKYYYVDSTGQQKGPIDVEDFLEYGIKKHTLIWQSGMQDWTEAGKVPEVVSALYQSREEVPPPPPQYASGSFIPSAPPVSKPDNLMLWSVLATVLCCLPLGIVAIVYSNKVDTLWSNRDYQGAIDAAKNAKTFCLISLGGGLIVSILYIFLMIVGALA